MSGNNIRVASQRASFYVESTGANDQTLLRGISWLNEVSAQQGAGVALLAVSQLSNLGGVISSTIGAASAARLKTDKRTALSSTLQLELLTEKDHRYDFQGPILVVYPTHKLLDKVDALSKVTAVCVVPWIMEDVRAWVQTWGAERLMLPGELAAASAPSPSFTLDPILRVALEELTKSVNLSTGITHSLDKAKAVNLFRLLRDAQIPFDPEAVKGWLLANENWKPSGANDVRQVAADILAGKSLQAVKIGGRPAYGKADLARWRAQAVDDGAEEEAQEVSEGDSDGDTPHT